MQKRLLYWLISTPLMVLGLEFGSMGNTSAAMGGAGVALKHSAWGLYYNPALLSADPTIKLGYSLGIGIKQHNLADVVNIDMENMQNTAERLVQTFANTTATSEGEVTKIMEEALKDVLTSTITGDVEQDLKAYLNNKQGGSYSDLITAVVSQVNKSSSLNQAQKDLLSNIAGNIDYDSLNFEKAQGANEILKNITISKGGDAGLDKAMSDIKNLQDILKDNNLNVISQNGAILQLSSKTLNQKLGSLGVAYFASVYSSMSIKADSERLRLIIDGNGGYYELKDNGGSYSYTQSSKSDYDKYSLIASLQNGQNAHKLVATSFILSEIPIGYARTFYLKNGNLNIGIAGKIMNAISSQHQINIQMDTDFAKELKDLASLGNSISSNNYGVDVGLLYEVDLPEFRYLTFGLVGKNLNSPVFKSTINDITIKPQYRLGVGYNSKRLSLAFDADLTPNELLAFSNVKQQSQMVGGGFGLKSRLADFRLGAMTDLRQDTGLILTGGINVLGFLDIALQSSTQATKIKGMAIPIPNYFNIRIGGSFSF